MLRVYGTDPGAPVARLTFHEVNDRRPPQGVDGAITARFEPPYPFAPEAEPWDRRPARAIGPDVDVEFAWQACMAQLAQQTGVVAEERWLTEPRATCRVPGPYGHYRDVEGADRI